MTNLKQFGIAIALVAAAACGPKASGGGTGPGGGGGAAPPPPTAIEGDATKPVPVREITKDARTDYASAIAFFKKNDDGGSWSEPACRQSAEMFQTVAREHKELTEAKFMVGLSYHRCNMLGEAESAYKNAGNEPRSVSNLGEIYFRQGKQGFRQYWDNAIKTYPKLIAARNNVAQQILLEMRKTRDKNAFFALDKQARDHLSSVLAVDNDNIKAYTLYALVYMEGRQFNKNRLDLAKLLMDEAEKRKSEYAPLKNARGLWYMHKNLLSEALKQFEAAVALDGKFAEARFNVGITALNIRKYDTAKEQLSKVLELEPKNYDAMIGLGIALRGMGELDAAEDMYKKARGLDGARGEAFFNLGVLYKDFRATKTEDLKKMQGIYREAGNFFREFGSKQGTSEEDRDEAKENVKDTEKLIAQLDQFMKQQAAMPPPPPPQPTPAPAPAPAPAPKK
jgi:tetratricopeptide (TPR) repeat protein